MQGGTCHRHPRQNDIAFFELWFGATKAGAVPGPVNFRLAPPDARLFATVAAAAVHGVVTD